MIKEKENKISIVKCNFYIIVLVIVCLIVFQKRIFKFIIKDYTLLLNEKLLLLFIIHFQTQKKKVNI